MTTCRVIYAGPIANGNGIEMVCACGGRKESFEAFASVGGLLSEHMQEAAINYFIASAPRPSPATEGDTA